MLFIALSLLVYLSYKQLPVELLPNAELPVLFVQVSSQQDMDPSYVESEVIIPLEGAVSAIGGVDKLQSYIDRRQSSIQIDFKKNINFKMTSLKLQEIPLRVCLQPGTQPLSDGPTHRNACADGRCRQYARHCQEPQN